MLKRKIKVGHEGTSDEKKIKESITKQSDATKITDLNDDCLFEIYKHLQVTDLATVADSCYRLRCTAKEYVARSKCKKLEFPYSFLNLQRKKNEYPYSFVKLDRLEIESLIKLLLKTAKVLRNFGDHITHFKECSVTESVRLREWINDIPFENAIQNGVQGTSSASDGPNFNAKFIDLLMKYCGESLVELTFVWLSFTRETKLINRPLFPHVQKLRWTRCHHLPQLFPLLPVWFPNVSELVLGSRTIMLVPIPYRFENVSKFVLNSPRSEGWTNDAIGEFLARNPQLTEFRIMCNPESDSRVLRHLNKYCTQIETLQINIYKTFGYIDYIYPSAFDNLNRLQNLRFVELRALGYIYLKCVDIVRSIVSAKIPLETLCVEASLMHWSFEFAVRARAMNDLVNEITKLKSLQALDYYNELNGREDILRICRELPKLTELRVYNAGQVHTNDVLNFVRAAPKLQWMCLRGATYIDDNTHVKLKDVIKTRNDDSQFTLQINRAHCKPRIPTGWKKIKELVQKEKEYTRTISLAVTVCGHDRENIRMQECQLKHSEPIRFSVQQMHTAYVQHVIEQYRKRGEDVPKWYLE